MRSYDSHLVFYELKKFDVKSGVIPNGLEKYMALMINKNFVFIDSMQFMNSSLEKLVKNLSNNDFKFLTQEFGSKKLELLKQKDVCPYEYMDNFCRSLKDGTTDDNGKKLNGYITDEEYLICIKIWNEFNRKNIGDYHDHYLRKDVLLLADIFEKFINTCLKFYIL